MLKQKQDYIESIATAEPTEPHNKAKPLEIEVHIREVPSVSKLVKDGRLRNNLTQAALANQTGLTTAEISRIEGGVTKKPTRKVLKALSPYTGIAYTRLLIYSGYSEIIEDELYYNKNGQLIPYLDIVDDIYKADSELLEILANIDKLSIGDIKLVIKLIKTMKYVNNETASNDLKKLFIATKNFLSEQLSAILNLFSIKSRHV